MNDLIETVDFMVSDDYKKRFIAEYWQTKIRYERLKKFNLKIKASNIDPKNYIEPKHDCPSYLLEEQQHILGQYLEILELRAILENIDLNV